MYTWQSIEAVDKIQTFLRTLYNKTETGFASLTVDAYGRLTTVNQRLSGLPHLKALTKEANVREHDQPPQLCLATAGLMAILYMTLYVCT
jgi:hypothetical protein